MCGIIVINKGEKEIETPRQFQEHFGFMPDKEIGHSKIELDYCLCQCDCEKALSENNIQFKKRLWGYLCRNVGGCCRR